MTKEEAKELLEYHSGAHEDMYNPKWEKGFLGMLRPYNGEIYEVNYNEVMLAIKTLAEDLRGATIERSLIGNLWVICNCTRSWAIDKDSMLRRNNLINEEQLARLTEWLDNISLEVMLLLQGEGGVISDEDN